MSQEQLASDHLNTNRKSLSENTINTEERSEMSDLDNIICVPGYKYQHMPFLFKLT